MNKQATKSPSNLNELLHGMIAKNASDLHLTDGLPPTIRVLDILKPLPGYKKLSSAEINDLIVKILNEKQVNILFKEKELDLSYTLEDKGRFRINVFFERGHIAVALRLIPIQMPTIDSLNLSHILYEFCKLPRGLVLITGPAGAGKSTTLAGMIHWMNENKNAHIITIEDPIEFLFKSNKSLIQQREINTDTLSWKNALRSVLREDPDVIFIGELRDTETISSAMIAAETGHLVLGTLHTNSAAQTIDRILGVFPEHTLSQARTQLASVIAGIVTQTLVIGIDKSKLFPALEILIASPALKNNIREGKTHQIDNIINTSADIGMVSLEKSLADLVNKGLVTLDVALTKTIKPKDVVRYVNKT